MKLYERDAYEYQHFLSWLLKHYGAEFVRDYLYEKSGEEFIEMRMKLQKEYVKSL